jgi:hypothetical protein
MGSDDAAGEENEPPKGVKTGPIPPQFCKICDKHPHRASRHWPFVALRSLAVLASDRNDFKTREVVAWTLEVKLASTCKRTWILNWRECWRRRPPVLRVATLDRELSSAQD